MEGTSNEQAGHVVAAGLDEESVARAAAALSRTADPQPTTPHEIALETGLLLLRHYAPETPRPGAPPVLLVYSLFKRPYILDLLPDRSVVRSLLRQGLSVYLTDWLPPSAEHAERGLHDYVELDLANAVECIRRREHVDRISLVGFCLGGFLATVYAALHPREVERLVVFALPFESRPPFAPAVAEYLARVYGNVPAWWMRAGLNARVSDPHSVPAYLATELGEPELAAASATSDAVALQRAFAAWLESDVPFAGRMFRDVMGEAYGERLFATSRLMVGGQGVVLANVGCPVLNVCAEHDKLVPARESITFIRHLGTREASNLVFDCGHLGLMLSRAAHDSLWPHVSQWLGGDDSGASTRASALTGTD
jgi:polyhydroxyalkanoate synthase subunit PhaC